MVDQWYIKSYNCYYEKKGKNTYNISKEIPFDIPNSWIWTRLSVLTSKIQYGLNYPSKMSGKNKYLRITDIQNNQVNWENVPYVNITKDEEGFLLNNNDIVFARTGATVGKSFLVINPPIGATFASYLIRIVINDYDIAQYLYSFFQSSFYWNQIIDKAIGSTQPNCNGTKLASLLVPVPPLCEIKKINEKINMILPKIENIIKLKKDTLSLVESLKKAILSSFFDSENSTYKSYYGNKISTTLKELIPKDKIGDGDWVLSENMDENGEYSLVQLKHIGNGTYNFNKNYNHINSVFFKQNNCSEIKENYILINRLITSNMNVCLLPKLEFKTITSVDICWIAPDERYNQEYIMYYLLSPSFQKKVFTKGSGSTRKRISKKNLINIPINIHELEYQQIIVNKIKEIFKILDSFIS